MSTDDQNNEDDLFDFPEASGVDSFGFEQTAEPDLGYAEPALTDNHSEEFEDVRHIEPVLNPPIPEGISDLEHDLFDFESASNWPTAGTLSPAPSPTPSQEPRTEEVPAAPSSVDVNAPVFATAPVETAEAAGAEPTPAAAVTEESAGFTRSTSLLNDRGPRITLPEDLPGTSTWERNRSLLALVGCFLLVNTGIFFLAQQASDRFNQTIADATGLMAQVLLDQQARDAQAAAPASAEPRVEHVIEPSSAAPEAAKPVGDSVEVAVDDALVDPLKYDNTHELGVARAKALMEQGKPEEARMLFNFILANSDRVPMRNSLREEIDYLIPLTYFEQGNLIAPEAPR